MSEGFAESIHDASVTAPEPMPPAGEIIPFARRDRSWLRLLDCLESRRAVPAEWQALFGPLVDNGRKKPFVVGQLGQSLDGRIATETGHSKYINGEPGLQHLHRLRAVCDAVIVGIGTAIADDPMLNVRLCEGTNPARVVIDPRGRLPISAKLLRNDGTRRIIITASETSVSVPADVEVIRLPREADGRLSPRSMVAALHARGLSRMLLEGGAHTISGFIAKGALDRLHMIVAPVIVGSGQPGLALPPINLIDEAIRPPTTPHMVGGEVIFDCDLAACRTG
jgi:diaminohydroxyphosphoribosylaminopyrimidine deaminase / 5-amino-6-(5-phosphoribosylamino)uracil reductase